MLLVRVLDLGGMPLIGHSHHSCPTYTCLGGAQRKMCVSTSEFYADGGILHKLQKLGAKPDKLCFTDNCNQ